MSQENVEIVRSFYEAGQRSLDAYRENPRNPRLGAAALEAGDLEPETEAVLSFLHPEVEYNAVPAPLEGGTARGHLGWLRSWAAILSTGEDLSFTINELVDLGGAEVFAAGSVKWKGRGMELSEPRFAVLTLRDGLIVRVNVYRDRDEALEAAGLTK